MKRVISISLGSSRRNKRVETTLRNEQVVLERIGADGDQKRMRQLFLEYDGQGGCLRVSAAQTSDWK